jgi:hypothetical protein
VSGDVAPRDKSAIINISNAIRVRIGPPSGFLS